MRWRGKALFGPRKTDLESPFLGSNTANNTYLWVLWTVGAVWTFVSTDLNPGQMKTTAPAICSTKFRCQRFVLLVASISIAALCHAQSPPKTVDIKGRILVDDVGPWDNSLTVVELDNTSCIPLEMAADGKFRLAMNVGNKAYLRFEHAGYLTKEILVDTKHADECTANCHKNEKLRFDVQMTPELSDKELHYAGPVGTITFVKGSGLMKVRFDRSLVRTSDGDIVLGDQRK